MNSLYDFQVLTESFTNISSYEIEIANYFKHELYYIVNEEHTNEIELYGSFYFFMKGLASVCFLPEWKERKKVFRKPIFQPKLEVKK